MQDAQTHVRDLLRPANLDARTNAFANTPLVQSEHQFPFPLPPSWTTIHSFTSVLRSPGVLRSLEFGTCRPSENATHHD